VGDQLQECPIGSVLLQVHRSLKLLYKQEAGGVLGGGSVQECRIGSCLVTDTYQFTWCNVLTTSVISSISNLFVLLIAS